MLVYLLLSSLCDIAQARTLWLTNTYTVLASLTTASAGLKLLALVLEAVGKDFLLVDKSLVRCPEILSGIFNRRLFWWLNAVFWKGLRCNLRDKDMLDIDNALRSTNLGHRFQSVLEDARQINQVTDENIFSPKQFIKSRFSRHKLFWVSLWKLKLPFLKGVPPRVCMIALKLVQPFLIREIVDSVGSESHTTRGYVLVGATGLVYVAVAVCTGYQQHNTMRFLVMLRGSLVATIYRALTLLPSSQTADNAAISLMSTDIEVINTSLQMIHECWAAPIEASVGIWLLAEQIGAISVATVGIAISKSPLLFTCVL